MAKGKKKGGQNNTHQEIVLVTTTLNLIRGLIDLIHTIVKLFG